jgi:hypothetical protein
MRNLQRRRKISNKGGETYKRGERLTRKKEKPTEEAEDHQERRRNLQKGRRISKKE